MNLADVNAVLSNKADVNEVNRLLQNKLDKNDMIDYVMDRIGEIKKHTDKMIQETDVKHHIQRIELSLASKVDKTEVEVMQGTVRICCSFYMRR